MKQFALSALVLTALACPAFANDELAAEIVSDESLVAECVIDDGAVLEVERCGTVVDDAESGDYVKRDDFGSEDPVDDSTVLDDQILTMTGGENTENIEDDPSIIYYNTVSTNTGGESADASLSVNQLADEQRTSLRLFSGRETATEHTGRAANLKEMFGGRSRVKVEAEAASPAVSAGERVIAQRKAEIDQLRDKALRTGDAALMARADAMAAAQTKGEVKGRSFLGFRRK